jgi:hypothetical protein
MCIRLLAFIAWTVMMAQATACLAAHIDIRPVPLPMAKSRARKELVSAVEDINREIRTDAVNCDGYYRSRARVLLDTTSAFSVQLSVDEYCGGPYPETDVKAVEFDADTGDRYSPLSLYEVGTQNDVDERVKWRDDIRQRIKAAFLSDAKAARDGGQCLSVIGSDEPDDYGVSAIDESSLGLGLDGLHVYPQPSHAVQACYRTVVLPYASLRPYLNGAEAVRIGWTEPHSARRALRDGGKALIAHTHQHLRWRRLDVAVQTNNRRNPWGN